MMKLPINCRLSSKCYSALRFLPNRNIHAIHQERVKSLGLDDSFNFIAGKKCRGNGSEITNIYPATGKPLFTFRECSTSDVDSAVKAASEAATAWRETAVTARAEVLRRVAAELRRQRVAMAAAEVLDTGKPLWEAQVDVDNCADLLDFYSGLAPLLTGQYCPLSGDSAWYSRREPFGVCGAIGAWNFPIQMAVLKSAPALLCGNTVVFKPAPATPTTARAFAEMFSRVGAPPGLFSVVQGGGEVGTALCQHPDIAKLSFTGGCATGSLIMRTAAERTLPVTLELGGKSPVLIFDDADVDEAVKGAVLANFLSQGQVCSNAARVFVQRPILEAFTKRLLDAVRCLQVGDPFDENVAVGALISPDHGARVMSFLDSALAEGARALVGGKRLTLDGDLAGGFFVPPTVLDNCHDAMRSVREEIFGPVLTLLPFDSEEEALTRANATEFGLAAGLFTQDLRRANRVAAKLQAGSLYVNNYNYLPPGLPFGGVKRSGLGRENAAMDTLVSYTQVKSVYVEGGRIDYPYPYPGEKKG